MMTLYAIAYRLNGKKYEIVEKVVESKNSSFSQQMKKHGYTVRCYDTMTLQRVAALLLEDGPMKDGSDPLSKPLISSLFPEYGSATGQV